MFSKHNKAALCAALTVCFLPNGVQAQINHSNHNTSAGYTANHSTHLQGHDHSGTIEPQSLMGTHLHKKGEWMVGYKYNFMHMDGMRDGTNDLSEADVIALANPNAPPANFRVVPTDMNMQMHMFSAMYGVTDWLTIMGMAMYMQNDMSHVTYNMGGSKIGRFETKSGGLGDFKLSGLMRLYEDTYEGAGHKLHLNLGVSLPTGDLTQEDEVLTPMGTRVKLRLPYAMQLGSGTYDALPGITYTGHKNNWGWGMQYSGEMRLQDENDEGYSLGDKHSLHSWAGYGLDNGFNFGTRLSYSHQDDINGRDSSIAAPVPTADPDNYGGERINLGLFAGFTPKNPEFKGQVFGIEGDIPLYQDLNGPQMKQDYSLSLRWSFGF
jgi:hypothetical protein